MCNKAPVHDSLLHIVNISIAVMSRSPSWSWAPNTTQCGVFVHSSSPRTSSNTRIHLESRSLRIKLYFLRATHEPKTNENSKTKNCLCSNLILPAPTPPLLRLRISILEQRNPVKYFPDFLVNLPSNFKEFSPYPASFQIPASTFFLNPKLRTNKIERSRFVS
jgi:hypothetical protein